MLSRLPPEVQQRLDELLEHLPAGVVVHGKDGRILSANRLACRLLDRSEKALIGTESDPDNWSSCATTDRPWTKPTIPSTWC